MSAESSPARPLRVGLTGGIASGKSTVAALFAARGVPVVDADRLARDVVRPGTEGLARVVEHFGETVLTAEGTLDRAELGRRVFADADARHALESIIHPLVREGINTHVRNMAAPYVLVVVPLLVESGMDRDMDRIVVIDTDEERQRERLRQRDHLSDEEAGRRIAAQSSRAERLRVADAVVRNEGPHDLLPPRIGQLHARYLAIASGDDPPG